MAGSSPDAKATGSPRHNLPALLTSLVGRGAELEGIAEAMRRSRLVTVTGPGGVGKTRLALELARRQIGRRADGVWLVDLALGSEAPDVAAETARTLDIRSRRDGSWTEALKADLADRDPLLVLDNCEHAIEPCAELAASLLAYCPKVRILATSRELLDLRGERVWRLDPLGAEDARRLFVERARNRKPGFLPDTRTEERITQLCARLDGLPLAIELAATRVGAMSVDDILGGLESQLDSLGRARLAPERQRTLRAVVDWSYTLLDATEQRALRDLAVFVSGFDATAAVAVAPGLSVDVLVSLVAKSLVSVSESPSGRTRYRLLETVRVYALEALAAAGELDAARERHARHFSAVADPAPEGWPSPDAAGVMEKLVDDYENVRAALEFSASSHPCAGLRSLAGMWDLFFMVGQGDGLRLGELLLERCQEQNRTRASVQIGAGVLRLMQADAQGASVILGDAFRLAGKLGERDLAGWARLFEGLAATLGGRGRAGLDAIAYARDLHHELGVRIGEGKAMAILGLIELETGDAGRARDLVEQALEVQLAAGDRWSQGQCHAYLGMIAEANAPNVTQATAHYRQAVECLAPFRDATLLPVALALQGGIVGRRDAKRGLKVIAAASAIRRRAGGEFAPLFRQRVERARSAPEAALQAHAAATWAEGERLTLDDATRLAFGHSRDAAPRPAGLTEREWEVVRLVADGLANKEIASSLHLSVRTVESHVRHALAKAGLENRTQLATWARERIQ